MSSEWTPVNLDLAITQLVKVSDITVDESLQMRADGLNEEFVKRYAGTMQENDPDGWAIFPPIKILVDEDSYEKILIAGFHRLAAMRLNDYTEISAIVVTGSRRDAKVIAVGENSDRSQPRKNADIQASIDLCLDDEELSQWSNAQIARWVGCDRQTVTNRERWRMSNAKFAVERPETLKFIDKYGNISHRKRQVTPEERKEDIEAEALTIAGIPTDDESTAEIERNELMLEIVNQHHKIEAIFIYGSTQERDTQRGFLLNQYPDLGNFYRKEELGNEDLQHLSDALKKIVDEGEDQHYALQNEIWSLYWDINNEIDVGWEFQDDVNEKIAESYPDFANVNDRDEMPIPRVKLLLKEVEAVAKEIETNGYQQFLPEGYVEDEGEEQEEDEKAGEELAEAANKAEREANAAFRELMGSDNLSWRVTDAGFSRFVKEHNEQHDGVKLTARQLGSNTWGWEDKPADEIRQIQQGYEELTAVIRERPDWLNEFIWDICAELSAFTVRMTGADSTSHLEQNIKPFTPLSADEYEMIANAIEKAIDQTYEAITNKRASDLREIKEANNA